MYTMSSTATAQTARSKRRDRQRSTRIIRRTLTRLCRQGRYLCICISNYLTIYSYISIHIYMICVDAAIASDLRKPLDKS